MAGMQGGRTIAELSASGTQRHLLLINRDWLMLLTLSAALRGAGYRITPSATGEDALAIAARDTPDLALLDARLPDMDGIEVGRRLRERGVAFICLSPDENHDRPGPMVEAGAYGFLSKTLDIQKIVPFIETALARASDIRVLRDKEAQLNAALGGSREIGMAVGMLMERDGVDRMQAFEILRSHARSQRRAVAEVAKELLTSAENLNAVGKLKEDSGRGKRRET